jgi:hypothetical protein
LSAAGLKVGTVATSASASLAAGLILSESPVAGARVPAGSSVNLLVSSGALAGVNYFFRRRQLFLPVLSLHHWSTIAQSDAKGVRSSGSEFSSMLRS